MTGILWAVVQSIPPLQPLYIEGTPHHVTLQYGVSRENWEHLIGFPMTAGAIAHCHNDQIQAIEVTLPTWCPYQNPHPHITVSWIHGADPVLSNVMLAGNHVREDVGYPIHTIIEWLEWGEPNNQERLCSVCKVQKLRVDNRTGICYQCQPRRQKNARYRQGVIQ